MDIKNLILDKLPEGIIGDLAKTAGVDGDVVEKIMDAGVPEMIKQGSETEGGLFDNLQVSLLSKVIAEKTGVDVKIVSSVVEKALPFIEERVDGNELMKIVGGLSDGFGMDDVQNIAKAIMSDDADDKKTKNEQGGFLGNILGGLLGKK